MTKAEAAAAIALAAEIKRRAQGPDHMARDGVTWTDLARSPARGSGDRRASNTPACGGVEEDMTPIPVPRAAGNPRAMTMVPLLLDRNGR